jgi:hypothetical protein
MIQLLNNKPKKYRGTNVEKSTPSPWFLGAGKELIISNQRTQKFQLRLSATKLQESRTHVTTLRENEAEFSFAQFEVRSLREEENKDARREENHRALTPQGSQDHEE